MKESKAMDLLVDAYGLVRGASLIQQAAILQGVGVEAYDALYSQQNRSKVTRAMAAVGVYWDDIEWDPGVSRWYVSLARRAMRKARRTA